MAKITTAVLRAAGCSPEQIATIYEIAEEAELEHQRELTRERVRAHRARNGKSRYGNDETRYSVTGPDEQPKSLELQETCNAVTRYTVTNGHRESSSKTQRSRSRKHRLPENWSVTEAGVTFARSHGWSDARIASEASRFVDHARASGRAMLDWQACWRNWVRSPFQNNGGNGHGGSAEQSPGDRARELAGLARQRELDLGIVRPPDPVRKP